MVRSRLSCHTYTTPVHLPYTDKKENQISLIYKEIQTGSVANSYMKMCLLIYVWLNICAFPHILGSPSSYMTLHPIPSEFPYIWRKSSFLFYQCSRMQKCPQLSLFGFVLWGLWGCNCVCVTLDLVLPRIVWIICHEFTRIRHLILKGTCMLSAYSMLFFMRQWELL